MLRRHRGGEGPSDDEGRDRPLRLYRQLAEAGRPTYSAAPCQHLIAAPARDVDAPDTCEDHTPEDGTIVHLRVCLECGHVGCCDSSVPRHATAHAKSSGHPVIQSAEPGEAWRWCYLDELLG